MQNHTLDNTGPVKVQLLGHQEAMQVQRSPVTHKGAEICYSYMYESQFRPAKLSKFPTRLMQEENGL